MSSMGELRDLTQKDVDHELLGVCQGTDSDHILATFNSEILLMQTLDSREINSWTCTQMKGQKFTSAAVFAPSENEFIVVQNEKTLRTFKESNLQETETFTLKHKVHSLVPCHNKNPLVLLHDGSIFHLHHVLEDPQNVTPDSSIEIKMKKIHHVSSFVLSDENILVCLICEEVNKAYRILASVIHPEENQVQHQTLSLEFEGRQLKSAAGHRKSDPPVISTIWDDGSLRLLRIVRDPEGELSITLEKISTLEINDDAPIVDLSDDQVAVLCKGENLAIVDLKFGTVLQKMEIGMKVNKILSSVDHILLDTRTHVKKIEFSARRVTLASAIFKQRHSQQICKVQHAQWTDIPKQNSLFSDKDGILLKTILKTTQETDFDKSWSKFWKGRSEDFQNEFFRSNAMRDILFRFGTDEKKKEVWPRSTIRNIISTGLVNGRWCDGIFAGILEQEDWELLLECLQKLNDIPEKRMVQCLTHLARPEDADSGMECDSVLSPQSCACINEIFQLSYSENLLRRELGSMPFHSVLNLVSYSTSLLEELSLASTSPSLDQVISWLSLIIDAHLSEIVMLEDSWSAIDRLQDAVQLQSEVFKELTSISRLLAQIQNKMPNVKMSRKLYSVEIMNFE